MEEVGHELTNEGQASRFISVGGITVGVKDFVDLWNGQFVLPGLSPHELEIAEAMLNREGVDALLANIPAVLFGENFPSRATEVFMTIKKYIQLRHLINQYKKTRDIEILSMHRVLAAISGDKMQFSSIGEFVAALPGVSPSGKEADLVEGAVKSLIEPSDREVSYVTEQGSVPVTDVIFDTRRAVVCDILGISSKKIEEIPLFVLERAAFGQEPTEDDIKELSRLSNIGSAPLVTTIQITKWVSMLGGWGMFAHSIYQMAQGTDATSEFKMGIEIFGMSLYLMLLYPGKARSIAVSLASSDKKYAKMYERLASKIEGLEVSPYGKIKVLILREIIKDSYSATPDSKVEELCERIDCLVNCDDDIEEFNSFANMNAVDYDNYDDVVRLLGEFSRRKDAEIVLERELDRVVDDDRRRTPSIALQKVV